MMNYLHKNKTTLIILLTSVLLIIIFPAVILKHFFKQDLKNWQVILTPLITIVLYISGLNKLDEWMTTKKRNTCIELMELISKSNIIISNLEYLYSGDLNSNSWIASQTIDFNSDFNKRFDELYIDKFNISLEIKEKIRTLKILKINYDKVIDELIIASDNVINDAQEWNDKNLPSFDPEYKFPITMYYHYLNKFRSSIKTNNKKKTEYSEKNFDKLFTIK